MMYLCTLKIKTMEKTYIIVGDNNFWYSTFTASTQQEIDESVKEARMLAGEYNEEVDPHDLFLYEVQLIQTIKNVL